MRWTNSQLFVHAQVTTDEHLLEVMAALEKNQRYDVVLHLSARQYAVGQEQRQRAFIERMLP